MPVNATQLSLSTNTDFKGQVFVYADGVGVDFTGCTAALAFRVVPSDPAPAFAISTTPSSSGSITLGTPTNSLGAGVIEIWIAKAALSITTPAVLHGDLLVTWTDGTTSELMTFDATVYQGSTY